LGAFFAQRDFAPQNPQGKKPGYPLQFLKNACGVFCGISAAIPCAGTKGLTETEKPPAARRFAPGGSAPLDPSPAISGQF
jgi:hypothetical protein